MYICMRIYICILTLNLEVEEYKFKGTMLSILTDLRRSIGLDWRRSDHFDEVHVCKYHL